MSSAAPSDRPSSKSGTSSAASTSSTSSTPGQAGKPGTPDTSSTPGQAPPSGREGRRPPKEEPEFVNERDLPTEDPPGTSPRGKSAQPRADVAGVESAAGEEDPGAALDSPPNPRSPA
jgi:hypothetical protein